MLSWSSRHQLLYGIAFFLLVFAMLGAVAIPFFLERPTCFDGERNGDERGTDCGGSCTLVCARDAAAPRLAWVRAFRVAEGVSGAAAYLENPNQNAGVLEAPYVFKLYDADNLLVYERHGEAFVPPRAVFSVFEGAMPTGDRRAVRATFAFKGPLQFTRLPDMPALEVRTTSLPAREDAPRLEASVSNPSVRAVANIHLTAILYGRDENALASSGTFIPVLRGGERAQVNFTWPEPFPEAPVRTEILYVVAPNTPR